MLLGDGNGRGYSKTEFQEIKRNRSSDSETEKDASKAGGGKPGLSHIRQTQTVAWPPVVMTLCLSFLLSDREIRVSMTNGDVGDVVADYLTLS